jgi:hypothetical protein
MLLKDIGRTGGGGVENLRPSDFTDAIPENLKTGCVGIFWHVGNNEWIIRKAQVLDDLQNCVELGQDYDDEENPDDLQIDFNRFHKDIWADEILPKNPKWKEFKFDHFSRGRIVFETLSEKFIIYIPGSPLFTQDSVLYLAGLFSLPQGAFDTNSEIYRMKNDLETLGTNENIVLPY